MGTSRHYPKSEYTAGHAASVLRHGRVSNKVVEMRREAPGNIILVHGVNDVGAGYSQVEEGLCAGLEQRLLRRFTPATYEMPTAAAKEELLDDPDAKFFKRTTNGHTDSPVIPFYWGYREIGRKTRTVNDQKTDRYGNRLDKALSKGGGPFGNATSTLPDMWNRGVGAPADLPQDPLRPLKSGPGRMYMVLAARRLAALVAMIRQYEANDTVTIVAHSQGCLLALLAQAFLMELGERTADTLILTHPPYSLEQDTGLKAGLFNFFKGGSDAPMEAHYHKLAGRQNLHARLQTLVNIVKGVASNKATAPVFAQLSEAKSGGMVEGRWKPGNDRDNRGKVYLYFAPEDMTVALDNMQGIGWQGVPDYIAGSQGAYKQQPTDIAHAYVPPGTVRYEWLPETVTRMPLRELGDSFRQRVFTNKLRFDPLKQKTLPVLVGMAPHDFALRIEGEDDHAHVEKSGRTLRASLPVAHWPIYHDDKPEEQRYGIRRINGEPLHKPCKAELRGRQIDAATLPPESPHAKLPPADRGPCDEIDPITAATAVTGAGGLQVKQERRPDPLGRISHPGSPQEIPPAELSRMSAEYNREVLKDSRGINDLYTVIRAIRYPSGEVVAFIEESPNAARLRWQHGVGAKSFHSAIFDSRDNHRHVTAYDVAIGSGKACSDPAFYAYLCDVADWRLKNPSDSDIARLGILTWPKFIKLHGAYFQCEPAWREQLIKGNCDYYSNGELPKGLPVMSGALWDIVISETTSGNRVNKPAAPKAAA